MKASELAQWVEALVARQDNLSLINLLTQIHIHTQVHLKKCNLKANIGMQYKYMEHV